MGITQKRQQEMVIYRFKQLAGRSEGLWELGRWVVIVAGAEEVAGK